MNAESARRAHKARAAKLSRESYHRRKLARMVDELVNEELELEQLCNEPAEQE